MKMSHLYLLAVAALVIFLYYLGHREPPPPPPPPPTPTQTPAPPPPPAPPAAAPAPAAAHAPTAEPARVQQFAKQMRVEVVQFTRQGGTGLLEVRWLSDVWTQGTDFAERLRTEGIIRMFEPDGPLRASLTPDGRRQFSVRFKLTF